MKFSANDRGAIIGGGGGGRQGKGGEEGRIFGWVKIEFLLMDWPVIQLTQLL